MKDPLHDHTSQGETYFMRDVTVKIFDDEVVILINNTVILCLEGKPEIDKDGDIYLNNLKGFIWTRKVRDVKDLRTKQVTSNKGETP